MACSTGLYGGVAGADTGLEDPLVVNLGQRKMRSRNSPSVILLRGLTSKIRWRMWLNSLVMGRMDCKKFRSRM